MGTHGGQHGALGAMFLRQIGKGQPMKHFWRPLALVALTILPASAETPDWASLMAEAPWDWHPGDLIFRNGFNELDDLIRDAEGGQWASVAMLRAASGDPRVVYVDPDQGVTEMMLDDYIAGLGTDDYAAYRVAALDQNRPGSRWRWGRWPDLRCLSLMVPRMIPG